MITTLLKDGLTKIERSQLERRDLARGSWAQGEIENATIILNSVLAEGMTPRVAVRCLVSQAAFRAEASDYAGSFESLGKAAELLDAADVRARGAFHNQRARIHNRMGNHSAALLDYAGASACFEDAEDRSEQGAAILNTAELYFQQGDLYQARENIDRALLVMLQCASEYLPQAYDTLANIDLAEGHIENAALAIKQAFERVGENEIWRRTFLETKEKIDKKVQELSGTLHDINVEMVRWALIKTNGNLTRAGKLTGLTHKGVSYIVDRHPELEAFRARRRTRTRLKSLIKN